MQEGKIQNLEKKYGFDDRFKNQSNSLPPISSNV